MKRYLLFDIDDTLLNFRKAADAVITRALSDAGLAFDEEQFRTYHRVNASLWDKVSRGVLSVPQLYAIRFDVALAAVGLKGDGAFVEARFRHHLGESAVPEEGAAETLAELSKRYILAAASNAPQRQQELRLEKAGLRQYFSQVLTSELLGHNKPSAAFFDACLERLGNPPRESVMMLGDSLTADVEAARAAGIDACFVNLAHKPEPPSPPYPVVHSLPELLKIL